MITNDEHHSSKDASALSKDANCLAAPGPAPSDHRRFSPPLLRVEAPVARPRASRSSARPDARLGRPRWRRARPANADGPRGCPSGLAVGARRPARGGRSGRLNRRCGGAPPPNRRHEAEPDPTGAPWGRSRSRGGSRSRGIGRRRRRTLRRGALSDPLSPRGSGGASRAVRVLDPSGNPGRLQLRARRERDRGRMARPHPRADLRGFSSCAAHRPSPAPPPPPITAPFAEIACGADIPDYGRRHGPSARRRRPAGAVRPPGAPLTPSRGTAPSERAPACRRKPRCPTPPRSPPGGGEPCARSKVSASST